MANWKIEGVYKETGKDGAIVVEADTEQDAQLCARLEHGLMIRRVESLDSVEDKPRRTVGSQPQVKPSAAAVTSTIDRAGVYRIAAGTGTFLQVLGILHFVVAAIFGLMVFVRQDSIAPGLAMIAAIGAVLSGVFCLAASAIFRLLVLMAGDVQAIARRS